MFAPLLVGDVSGSVMPVLSPLSASPPSSPPHCPAKAPAADERTSPGGWDIRRVSNGGTAYAEQRSAAAQAESVSAAVAALQRELRPVDRRRLFSVYRQCFPASEALAAVRRLQRCSHEAACALLQRALQLGLIQHADTAYPQPPAQPRGAAVPPFDAAASSLLQFTALMPAASATQSSASAASPSPAVTATPEHSGSALSSGLGKPLAAAAESASAAGPKAAGAQSPSAGSTSGSQAVAALSVPPLSGGSSASPGGEVLAGWLDKRAESGLHSYQRRYFVLSLSDQSLCYYRTPESVFPMAFLPLSDVLLAQQLHEQKKGARLDVVMSHRVLHLLADSAKSAQEWAAAIARAVKDNRDRQSDKAAMKPRQAEPRTPTLMKPFWQQGLGGLGALSSTPSPSARGAAAGGAGGAGGALSALKAAFFQLNFSVSALNQPDFFHDLLEDFHSDDDILAFLLDALLHPDNSRTRTAAALPMGDAAPHS